MIAAAALELSAGMTPRRSISQAPPSLLRALFDPGLAASQRRSRRAA
jgi:hypothetical protein